MTKQIYTTAHGKSVDLGTIKLKNEHVRAVGNMNVNARGDLLDSNNQVIETKNQQIQRQNAQLTNVSEIMVHTSSAAARRARMNDAADEPSPEVSNEAVAIDEPHAPEPVVVGSPTNDVPASGGGLAGAIARSKTIKQEKEKTLRQMQQDKPGVRKI